ncbi:extracellular solute-binding protein [Ectobacillus ponti]|uniref:Extracellular solute-binding protein n=1 Tax=Ectobacillus ponti TaxID=2961894 RepID=A0AA42BRJ7_9BACI|nr:extracellular solute-binding protein [Ectobacillus ponti]MCP8971022.1 extracellular solute-binding protein [Ectobacillus ponti]
MFKQMKKVLKKTAVVGAAAAVLVSAAGCGKQETAATAAPKDPVTIKLYSGGSLNVQKFWETVLPEFEKTHPEIKVDLVFLPAGQGGQSTIDKLIAAKKAGADSEVDVYEGGAEDIVRGEKEGGLFEKLDTKAIPNLSKVAAENLKSSGGYAVPYRASSVVLAYNSDKVKDVPNTADELYQWIHQHPGRFAYNDPNTGGAGASFVLSTVYNTLPADAMNSQDPSIMQQWDKGFAMLKSLAPDLYNKGVYPRKNQGTLDLLANGEVDMIPAWSDMSLEALNKGTLPSSVKLKQIKPAFTGGPAYLLLPKNGNDKRLKAAETLLNYTLEVKTQETVANKMFGYPGIDWKYLSKDMQKQFESVSGGYRFFNGGQLGGEVNKRWQKEIAGQ